MISLITGAFLVQASNYGGLPPQLSEPSLQDRVHDYFSGWRAEGHANSTIGPLCPSSGRVYADPHVMPMSDTYIKFLNGKAVKLSINEKDIVTLIENVAQGKLSIKMLRHQDLFQVALSAGAMGAISIEDIASLRIWQQATRDLSSEHPWKLEPLLDDSGNWNKELEKTSFDMCRHNHCDKIEKIRLLIQQLPPSQQFVLTGSNYGHGTNILSLEGTRMMTLAVRGMAFKGQPRLGTKFSRDALTNAEIDDKARLIAIPPAGTTTLNADLQPFISVLDFILHDVGHMQILSTPQTATITALLELIPVFRQLLQTSMTPEIFYFADFAHFQSDKSVNVEFSHYIKRHKEFHWAIALHIQANAERWKNTYGLMAEEIKALKIHWKIINQSKSFLEGYSMLEKVYLLQKLNIKKGVPSLEDLESFFRSEMPLPPVTPDMLTV